MFTADILNMAGGRDHGVDLRKPLCRTASLMMEHPQSINLYVSPVSKKYDGRRIPVVLPEDENGELSALPAFEPFSTHALINTGSGLVKQLGHLAVQDACGDGSYNSTNLLYSGTFVIEYDLVEKDDNGKHYVYSEPSILEEVVSAKNEGRFGVPQPTPTTGFAFIDDMMSTAYGTINEFIDEEGPYVSSGKLTTDIMVLMRLYEEEARRAESVCIDPAFRKVLATCSGGVDAPLFKVAFITNAALMGLKVVFYPTALDPSTIAENIDSSVLKSLLSIQTATLAHCMPEIVKTVEDVSKKYVFCFKQDVRGSSNWNLPGHTKTSDTAFPYHHTRLRGDKKNVLEISNRKIVTSLGVVDAERAAEWMYGTLDEFHRRASYASTLGHGVETLDSARWRREVLFGDVATELPFRNKSALMDPDFCLSGMCYHYLASGQGVLLTKRTDAVSSEDSIFADLTTEEENGSQQNETGRPAMPSVPQDTHVNVINGFDEAVCSKMDKIVVMCDKFGMFLEAEPGFTMRVLKASKPGEKKAVVQETNSTTGFKVKILSNAEKITYESLAVFSLAQLVIRHEIKQSRMILPRDNALLCKTMKKRVWTSVSLPNVWQLAHEESFEPPTDQSLEGLEPPEEGGASTSGTRGYSLIDKMMTTTSSTFATGADKRDTMFSWTMVVLAERFCALYNIVSNPEKFYEQVTTGENRLGFAGGLPAFKKMCRHLLPELEIYVPRRPMTQMKVCREAIRGFESAVVINKNMTNSKVCKVKLAEFKMLHNIGAKSISCLEVTRGGTFYTGSKTLEALKAMFEPLRKEEHEKRRLDGEDDDDVTVDRVMDNFFHCVNDNRTFKYRAALCHRQEYVALDVLQLLEQQLGRLLTVRVVNGRQRMLSELHVRTNRVTDWVVPFSMPVDNIDDFLNLGSKEEEEDVCRCFGAYSGSESEGGEDCGGCLKLLIIPQSIHLKNLIVSLRFNTMASERRYFSDVSTALGFTRAAPAASAAVDEKRWAAMSTYKCDGEFLNGAAEYSGLYTNVMRTDRELVDALRPRMLARKKVAEANNAACDVRSNKHTGFFAGVWALCSEHDLETTALGPTVNSPDAPTSVLCLSDTELRVNENREKLATEARHFFKENSSVTFYECFKEMLECVRRTTVTRASDSRADVAFFSGLVRKYGGGAKPPGAKLWTLLETVSSCFKNSLPVDWQTIAPDWTNHVLNLTEGAPNIDESGAVFEASRFISVCARSFFGDSLDKTLSVEKWTELLTDDKTWVGDLARAYEVAVSDNDIRAIECFIDSSNFMTNNNMAAKLKLKRTEDEKDRYNIWTNEDASGREGERLENEEEEGGLAKRAEWLAAAEAGLADQLSFSFVLSSVCLFRTLLDGDSVHDLAAKQTMARGQMVPLIRGIKITSKWCKTFVTTASSEASALRCISEGRFSDVERDPLFFYRFMAYTVGLVVVNDVVFETIARRILDSFDFNGFDTSNWTQFIRHHFPAILMGRRARLLSRPLAFIKSLVGLASTTKKFMRHADTEEELKYEKRVCAVMARLAKLILVKNVDSEPVTKNDILECCILRDEDVTVTSISAFYDTVAAETDSDKLDFSYTKASNACSNTQLAKMKNSARLINPNVYFNDVSCLALSIDNDEESLIDPSREAALSTADAEVGRGGKNKDSEESRLKGARSGDDAAGRHPWAGDASTVFEYDDEGMDDDNEPPAHEIMSKSLDLLKKIKTMLRQSDINDNVVRTIRKTKRFMMAQLPFAESDYEKHGVGQQVMKAGVEALVRWNEAVTDQCAAVVRECENLQTIGEEYDMSIITPADYGNSKNCTYISEAKISKTSFTNALADRAEEVVKKHAAFSWISLDPEAKIGSAQSDALGGARVKGHVFKDLIQFADGGTAEVRVLAELFSSRVKDPYWSDAMPVVSEDAIRSGKKKWTKDAMMKDRRPVANLRLNNKMKETVSLKHHRGLASLYTVHDEATEEDGKGNKKDANDVYVVLGNDTSQKERYKCLQSLWCCNNGIHPKNQMEMLKKLLFKNTNGLWIRIHDRHIAVLNNWGFLNVNNANDLHFGLSYGNPHAEVTDTSPPLSLFHSRFLSESDLAKLLDGLRPMRDPAAVNDEALLMRSVYSREVLSSCLDPRGNFMTASVTNSTSVFFTPGTRLVNFAGVSSLDRTNEAYQDDYAVGKEKELFLRNFLSVAVEVIGALNEGVFFQGERASGAKATAVSGGRMLRPVDYSSVSLVSNNETPPQMGGGDVPRGSVGVFEAANNNNVLSETNECALVNCHKARGLVMSLRAVLNDTVGKRYDGQVFDTRSMRYHAGHSKGCLLDDNLDLFSMYGQTNSTKNRQVENDTALYARCADHYGQSDADRTGRIFLTDWVPVVCMVGFTPAQKCNKYINATLTPYDVSDNDTSSLPRRLKNVSPYNCKALETKTTRTACVLANPCGGAVRWMVRRAPNTRVCLTNAGTALISRRIAQTDRGKTVEDLIIGGSITSFKLASNSSCVSVDNNRYFLIDGNFLVGGRVEERNLMTDIYMRCKMKSEKHTVLNSLFPSNVTSAFLATAVEGTTHGQGLALIEHVSSMKNMEVPSRSHKNFWSDVEGREEEEENVSPSAFVASPNPVRLLTPPSVYTNDEDYVLLRMIYEIATSAHYYVKTANKEEDDLTTDKLTNDSATDVDTTKAALYAMLKCYIETVDQKTGMPRKHAIHFLRALLNFGGFVNAISSGDGEKSHHLLYTMNIVAMNMAAKAMVMLVGPSGNNLKTTIVEVLKSSWLALVADLSVGALNSSGDSTSSTQANLAYVSGKKTILFIDEVGYQGSAPVKGSTAAGEERSYGDIKEISASHGVSSSQDSTAVWDQIHSSMTNSKMKICARECDEVMAARARATSLHAVATVRRKRMQPLSAAMAGEAQPITSSRRLLQEGRAPVSVNAFASTAMWWNCMSGTVMHRFDDRRTCFNMIANNEYPFSSSNFHSSPWLEEEDALLRAGKREKPGFFTKDQVMDALHTTLGNFADDDDLLSLIMPIDNTTPPAAILKNTTFKASAKRICEQLISEDSLLRWVVTSSVRRGNHHSPVLSCVPSDEQFARLLREIKGNADRDVHLANHAVFLSNGDYRLTASNLFSEDTNRGGIDSGTLYAFHAVYSVGHSVRPTPKITTSAENTENADVKLGPVLGKISHRAIENHVPESAKLSSVIFCGDASDEIDEDSFINAGKHFDAELLKIIEKPGCKSFPRISTDGSSVMGTSKETCGAVLQHMKRNIVDTMKVANTGTFVARYIEMNRCAPVTETPPPSTEPTSLASSMFNVDDDLSKGASLSPREKALYVALSKYKSDGRTTAASAIANAVASDVNSAVSSHMYPGQFDSNTIKKITSKHASAAIRALHCKPIVTSITMTPIMTSNSYVFKFFVDKPLLKRMIIFPCNTQFVFSSQNEDVQNFLDVVDNGLKCVHSLLLLERDNKWRSRAAVQDKADDWVRSWNESVQRGLGERSFVNDLSAVTALLPAKALQMLVKNSVLEHRDVTSMAKLEECGNTLMHAYTTLTLASRSEIAPACDEEDDDDGEGFAKPKYGRRTVVSKGGVTRSVFSRNKGSASKRKNAAKHLQMCNVNPKSLNTMAMAVNRSRQGAWAKINAAMNCVMFVDTPFVESTRLYGEGCNLKLFVPGKAGVSPHINLGWCIGLRMPNPDMGVKGYSSAGPTIGAGLAIMKQVCDAWGTTDIRNIMYSCHHLHMLFELVLQFTYPKRRLTNINGTKRRNEAGMDYVSVLFVCEIYKEMVKKLRFPVFESDVPPSKKEKRNAVDEPASPMEIPMFMSMIINKPLGALRSTTNLSNLNKQGARNHSNLVKSITVQTGHKLNPAYLCPSCKRCQ